MLLYRQQKFLLTQCDFWLKFLTVFAKKNLLNPTKHVFDTVKKFFSPNRNKFIWWIQTPKVFFEINQIQSINRFYSTILNLFIAINKCFSLVKGVFSWIGRISKRFLEFYCVKTIIDFLMRFILKVLLTLRLQNSENLCEKKFTVWPQHPCEHRPSKKSWLMVPTKSQKWLVWNTRVNVFLNLW